MKYKLKVIPDPSGGFVGFALLNDEVVFSTEICPDPQAATRKLNRFLEENVKLTQPTPLSRKNSVVGQSTNESLQGSSIIPQEIFDKPRSCCGRG